MLLCTCTALELEDSLDRSCIVEGLERTIEQSFWLRVKWKSSRSVAHQAYVLVLVRSDLVQFWARIEKVSKLFYSLEAEIGCRSDERCSDLKMYTYMKTEKE